MLNIADNFLLFSWVIDWRWQQVGNSLFGQGITITTTACSSGLNMLLNDIYIYCPFHDPLKIRVTELFTRGEP